MGYLSPDADYADYATDSAFGRAALNGRAAPNGRGITDILEKSNTPYRNTSNKLHHIIKFRNKYSILICDAETIGSGASEASIRVSSASSVFGDRIRIDQYT